MFGFIDQNNVGLVNVPGNISNTNQGNMPSVTINGAVTGENMTLPSGNSAAVVKTQNLQSTDLNGVTTYNYGLKFQVNGLLKLPVSVELQQGTASVPGVVVPTDIVTGVFNGNNDEFDYNPNLNGDIPKQGDSYKLFVTYSDSTTAVPDTQTLTVTVGAPLGFATNLAPYGTGVIPEPNFNWSYPSGASSNLIPTFGEHELGYPRKALQLERLCQHHHARHHLGHRSDRRGQPALRSHPEQRLDVLVADYDHGCQRRRSHVAGCLPDRGNLALAAHYRSQFLADDDSRQPELLRVNQRHRRRRSLQLASELADQQ
jgi:hypothetical protein